MADISKIKVLDGTTYNIKDAKALPKTTYEYNKEISFGSSGKLLIGKFACYDTNVTIEINTATSITYHAVAILATQNINDSHGGSIKWNVYGDSANTVAPNLYLYYPPDSRWIEIYFSPASWSKNLIHIQCIGLQAEATNVCEKVSAIPETATTKPTNVTTALALTTNPSARPTTANTNYHDGLLRYYLATGSMTTGKPPNDAQIIHLAWDYSGWDRQIAVVSGTAANGPLLYIRQEDGSGNWGNWTKVLDKNDLSTATNSTSTTTAATPSAVKTAYDLANTANGTANTALSGVNGNLIYDHTFTISNGVATFTPHVYQKGSEVTTNYAKSCFTWKYRLIDGSEVTLTTKDNRGCDVTITNLGYGGHVIGIFTPA